MSRLSGSLFGPALPSPFFCDDLLPKVGSIPEGSMSLCSLDFFDSLLELLS